MVSQNDLYKSLRVLSVEEKIKGFKLITFEEQALSYRAGQYLTFVRWENGEELRRSYSITSSPVLHEPLAIGVKRVENGVFSRALVDYVKPGDELVTTGSGGLFVLPNDVLNYQQLIFFAAGSGITPVYSLVKTVLHAYPSLSVVLVYSNASVEKTIFLSELQALQQRFPSRFQLELLFSNATNLSRARLHRDLIFSLLKQYVQGKENETLFYVCGPESYMRLCTYTLQESGIDPSAIKKENFYIGNRVKRDALPPDKGNHSASISMKDGLYTVAVHYPDSILRAARKVGLVLPYSCEAGRCGNCVAQCERGTVWHSYNEVLTEKELQQGLVLTCVGHPVGGDVVLKL